MVYIADDGSLPPEPNNYLCLAIFSVICCCIPCGIVAIIMSLMVRLREGSEFSLSLALYSLFLQVSQRYARGDYLGARQASQYAKMWAVASILCGVVASILSMWLSMWLSQAMVHHMVQDQPQDYTYQ